MNSFQCYGILALLWLTGTASGDPAIGSSQVRIENGTVEGVVSADDKTRAFKGIPYAAPPIGPLRWREPQPVANWTEVRKAAEFGPRCMQGPIYPDMVFRDAGSNEDCLYLNVWMPAHPVSEHLPVMVWIHGGGFAAGASSEPRQDGENLSEHGVVVVSMNYRLGVFGFLALPELAKESSHGASGDYGLLDQVAALRWVHANIAAFGGNPNNVTIFGESAGASSVSALMASPLAKGLFARAIAESGSALSLIRPMRSFAETAQENSAFVNQAFGTALVSKLREQPAQAVLEAALKAKDRRFAPIVDGYFLPENPLAIYRAGQQAHVPLLAGWNKDEGSAKAILGDKEATPANLNAKLRELFPRHAAEAMRLYPATSDEQARQAAEELSEDRGVGYAMWKWLELQMTTGGGSDLYRYEFDRPRAQPPGSTGDPKPRAFHSAEIEFVFSNLPSSQTWSQDDTRIAETMSAYWANFAKTGDPNGKDLPAWPKYSSKDGYEVMHFNAESKATSDGQQARYRFLDSVESSPSK